MMIARSVWLYKAQKSSSSCHDGGEDFDGICEEGGGTGEGVMVMMMARSFWL